MHATTPQTELTRLVRIVYDDGSEVETLVTPALAASLRRMEWADEEREREHRAREKNFTDAKPTAREIARGLNRRHPKTPEKPGRWEGPRFSFTLLYGYSAVWDGPRAMTVVRGGHRVCRFCFKVKRMPTYACCLGCSRTGKG